MLLAFFSFVGSVLLATAIAFVVFLTAYRYKRMKGVPECGGSYPILGSLITFSANYHRINDWVVDECKLHGWKTWGGGSLQVGVFKRGLIMLTSPADVKYVLHTAFNNFEKGEQLKMFTHEFFGEGIFASDGKRWQHSRKVASQMFTKRLLGEGAKVAKRQGAKLFDRIDENIRNNKEFDLQDFFFRFTMDTFVEIAFGHDLKSLQSETPHPFAVAFDDVQRISNERLSDISWVVSKFFQLGNEAKLTEGVKVIDQFAHTVINSKRRVVAEGEEGSLGPDLISRFLDTSVKTGVDITNKELRDIVLNFIIAGRDTTACALSWLFYELSRHPELVPLILAEEDYHLAQKAGENAGAANDADDEDHSNYNEHVGKLTLLHAVICEVLRLHPSVPKDTKFAIKDCVLPDGTPVQSGCAVTYCIYAQNRNPNLWEDPLRFSPARWLCTPEQAKKQEQAAEEDKDGESQLADDPECREPFVNVTAPVPVNDQEAIVKQGAPYVLKKERTNLQYFWPVFNAGRRICLGKPLAFLEIKLLSLMLLRRYKFTLSRNTDDQYINTIVLPMKHGLWVKAEAI